MSTAECELKKTMDTVYSIQGSLFTHQSIDSELTHMYSSLSRGIISDTNMRLLYQIARNYLGCFYFEHGDYRGLCARI